MAVSLKDAKFLGALRKLSLVEGISTLLLFGVAMPLKYWAGMPKAVTIVGSLHGALFVALVAMFALAIRRVPIPTLIAGLGVLAAIIPFGPFLFDHRLRRLEVAEV
jgi:integral membrane protein